MPQAWQLLPAGSSSLAELVFQKAGLEAGLRTLLT